MAPKNTIPVYEQIANELQAEITGEKHKIHERFLSERELTKRFKVNAATARKAVNKLVQDGLLYKRPTCGTYIAPPRKNKMILIVIPHPHYSLASYCAVEEFIETPYRFQEVAAEEYLRHVDDIQLLYPELAGIIFYRNNPAVSHTFEKLEEQDIKYIMYGSSTLRHLLQNRASLFYSEKKIVYTALDHLKELGCKKIGIVYSSSWPAILERFRMYLQWHQDHSIAPYPNIFFDDDLFPILFNKRYQKYLELFKPKILGDLDAIFATNDNSAAMVLQALRENQKKIPNDIKVVGVNNDPLCKIIQPQLTSVDIPVEEDAYRTAKALIDMIEGKAETPKLNSNVKLIKRGSTVLPN